jgi:hypothetical protein
MRDAIAKLDADRRNLWHDVGIAMQDAFEDPTGDHPRCEPESMSGYRLEISACSPSK